MAPMLLQNGNEGADASRPVSLDGLSSDIGSASEIKGHVFRCLAEARSSSLAKSSFPYSIFLTAIRRHENLFIFKMKTGTVVLLALFSSLMLFCAQGATVPLASQVGRLGRGLERRMPTPGDRILPGHAVRAGDNPRGPVLRVNAVVPHWWPNFARHRGNTMISPFEGNRVISDRLIALRRQAAIMEAIRM